MKVRKQLYRAAAATVLGLSLTTGIVAADSANISGTGTDSVNHVSSHKTDNSHVWNNNNVSATNSNWQTAHSGSAGVYHNTTGGSATSGTAANANAVSATVSVKNSSTSGGGGGSALASTNSSTLSNTGTGSYNSVRDSVTDNSTVANNNNLHVSNNNAQYASSGDATVAGNTTGGSATSGNATNTTSATFTFNVTN